MVPDPSTFAVIGAGCFGLVVGWITYRTLRRREGAAQLSDVATVLGAVGGAAVTAILDHPDLLAGYSIGLAVGFFGYLLISFKVTGKADVANWMGDR